MKRNPASMALIAVYWLSLLVMAMVFLAPSLLTGKVDAYAAAPMGALLYLGILPGAFAVAMISNIAMIVREHENAVWKTALALQFIGGILFVGVISFL